MSNNGSFYKFDVYCFDLQTGRMLPDVNLAIGSAADSGEKDGWPTALLAAYQSVHGACQLVILLFGLCFNVMVSCAIFICGVSVFGTWQ